MKFRSDLYNFVGFVDIDVLQTLDRRYVSKYVSRVDEDIVLVEGSSGGKSFKDIISRLVRFDETTSYNFGLWIGDRWGGKSRVGLKGKDIELVNAFHGFLKTNMKQSEVKFLILTKKGDDANLFEAHQAYFPDTPAIRTEPTMYGRWIYATYVQNGALRTRVMQHIEENINKLLRISDEKVSCAFIAGAFSVENACEKNKKRIAISVSLQKKSGFRESLTYMTLLESIGIRFFTLYDRKSMVIRIPKRQLAKLMVKVGRYMRCKSFHSSNFGPEDKSTPRLGTSMSALPNLAVQKRPRVRLFADQRGT